MAVKCRIIECKESFQDWDKFVCAIGMPELMNITEGQMENLYEGDNHFRKFKYNPDKDINILYSVVPYGAGGSFLGVIQEVAKNWVKIEGIKPEDRKANLWDDSFGLNFRLTDTFDIPHMGATAILEEKTAHIFNGTITWEDLWGQYNSWLTKFTTTHEIQVHVDLLTLPFFVETECLFLLDLDFETFIWTHVLADMKHSANGLPGALCVKKFVDQAPKSINSISYNLQEWQKEWNVYNISKKYGQKPLLTLSYNDLVVKQEYDAIKQYLEATKDADTSDEMIATVQDLLKRYHNENLKIMTNWDKVKNKVLNSHKWDRTHG